MVWMFVSSKIHVLKPDPHGNIRRQSLWEVIRSRGQKSYECNQCSYKTHPRELPSVFCLVRLQEVGSTWMRALNWWCWHLVLRLSPSRTVRNKFVSLRYCNSLWYFVIATPMDKDKLLWKHRVKRPQQPRSPEKTPKLNNDRNCYSCLFGIRYYWTVFP